MYTHKNTELLKFKISTTACIATTRRYLDTLFKSNVFEVIYNHNLH